MSAHNMDVFSLRDTVVGEYRRFATSFTRIHAEDIRQQVEAIYAGDRYWPEPLIQINPNYKRTTSIDNRKSASPSRVWTLSSGVSSSIASSSAIT